MKDHPSVRETPGAETVRVVVSNLGLEFVGSRPFVGFLVIHKKRKLES